MLRQRFGKKRMVSAAVRFSSTDSLHISLGQVRNHNGFALVRTSGKSAMAGSLLP